MELNRFSPRRIARQIYAGIDTPLLCIVLALSAVGLATLYSATLQSAARVLGQTVNLLVAFAAMWLFAKIAPQRLMRFALPAYVIGILLLVAVLAFGDIVNGAKRWLHVGATRFQPAEMMKLAAPLFLAWFFHRSESALRFRNYVAAGALLIVPVWLIAKQPDLGTALVVAAAGTYAIFFAGLGWRIMAGLAACAIAAGPLVWGVLHGYQRKRILTLLDPGQDPLGAGYHIIQSTIAIGSGGFTGKGWLQGTQSRLDFIPEQHTDFIFAVFSEEFGLIGNLLLLLLYAALIGRALMIAAGAPNSFSRLLAGSIAMVLFTYVFVNIGMVAGILPVVGVPLPFLSYGGSALLTLFIAVGMLMSIHRHRTLVQS